MNIDHQINIVCSINDAYVPWCGILLTSMCMNTKHAIKAFILTRGLTTENEKSLKRLEALYNIKVEIIVVPKSLLQNADFRIYPGDHVTEETFYRLFITELLPKDVHKVIYLDVDMICIDDINKLWEENIDGYAALVSEDLDPYLEEFHKRLGLPDGYKYFCAGMMVLNLDYWREHNIMYECIQFNNCNHDIIKLHDQDILNCILQNSIRYISYKWQFQTLLLHDNWVPKDKKQKVIDIQNQGVSIVHYSAPIKPWMPYFHIPYLDFWRYYKKNSLWKNTPLVKNGSCFDQMKRIIKYILTEMGIVKHGYYIMP